MKTKERVEFEHRVQEIACLNHGIKEDDALAFWFMGWTCTSQFMRRATKAFPGLELRFTRTNNRVLVESLTEL